MGRTQSNLFASGQGGFGVCPARTPRFGQGAPSSGQKCPQKTKEVRSTGLLTCNFVVGTTGFEPAASRSRTVRATKLRHVPMVPYVTTPGGTSRRLRATACEPASTVRRHHANRASGAFQSQNLRFFRSTSGQTSGQADSQGEHASHLPASSRNHETVMNHRSLAPEPRALPNCATSRLRSIC